MKNSKRLKKAPAYYPPSTSHQPLILLSHCSLILDDHLALDDISFELRAGERWVLMGPNGAGKSMLLKMLRGDVWPTPDGRERRVYNFDGELTSETRHNKRRIAYLAPERQDRYVHRDWNLQVTQIVATGLFDEDIPLTQPNAAQRARVEALLRQFQLWSLRDRRMLSLSYGQRRRVLLARALAGEPAVLLLDEVFNGLDQFSRRILQKSLERLSDRKMTWVLTAHRAADVPKQATHFARIVAGKIMQSGPLSRERERAGERGAGKLISSVGRAPLPGPLPAGAGRGNKNEALIRLKGVELFRDYRPVLKKFDWQIDRGEHWAIMGRNGSGKSSLLLLLYGDLHPALGGRIERTGMKTGGAIAQWKKRVGFVSPELQAAHFRIGSLEEIVASGRYSSVRLNQSITAVDRRHARKWLKFFGIEKLQARGSRQVSYGQLRLALIARAMVNEPELLLLDEPFAGLDPEAHARVFALLQRLAEQDTQIVLAVHDRQDIVPAIDKVLQIERGGIVSQRSLRSAVE